MKEILDKLEKFYDKYPKRKEFKTSVIGMPINFDELYKLYEFTKTAEATINQLLYSMPQVTPLPDIKYHCTVIGDCGKVHNSIQEWQECKVCDTMMQKKTLDR